MSVPDIAQNLTDRGVTVIADKSGHGRRSVVFAGSKDLMAGLTIGNTEAWRKLIADNTPDEKGLMYVRLTIYRESGTVRILTPLQARRAES